MNQIKKAFTLVELIVVITILAILGTIAFISLQGYSRDARDSVRTSDMSRIKTSLELFQLDAGKYPETTNKFEVTYKGGTTWNQGIFGNSTFNNVEKLDKIPKDPSTDREYIYSVTNTKQEYEIAGIMEGDITAFNPLLMNVSLAGDKLATAKVSGNYNGKILKVSTGGLVHVLAIPSLITSSESTLEDIVTNKNFVYNGYKNLPYQYEGSSYNTEGEEGSLVLVNPASYELYSGSTLESLSGEDPAVRIGLMQSLQSAYTGTSITEDSTIQEILSITDFTDTNSIVVNLAGTVVNNNLGATISINGGNYNQEVITDSLSLDDDSSSIISGTNLPVILTQEEGQGNWKEYQVIVTNKSDGAILKVNDLVQNIDSEEYVDNSIPDVGINDYHTVSDYTGHNNMVLKFDMISSVNGLEPVFGTDYDDTQRFWFQPGFGQNSYIGLGGSYAEIPFQFNLNQSYSIEVTFNGEELKVFSDGVLLDSILGTSINANYLRIGAGHQPDRIFKGTISNITLNNNLLTTYSKQTVDTNELIISTDGTIDSAEVKVWVTE